ncbi:MAG: hypothetical protein HZC17_06770 [Candidatus Omnitrophica bacterium]|nr:hypothetical protein [Candidatus Omnitrophota bacterium]
MPTKLKVKNIPQIIISVVVAGFIGWGVLFLVGKWNEVRVLKEIVRRLTADTRVAEVLVTNTGRDEKTSQLTTTIKFLEFDALGKPLAPKYFTFKGNIIQFQSLVIRFKDKFVESGDALKGKSVYIFLKAFVLEKPETQIMTITPINEIPDGYKIPNATNAFEKKLWEKFWSYALDPATREHDGVKSAQIEAPGSVFVPGTIYTLKIEHDGGLRIDTQKIPEILKGERL